MNWSKVMTVATWVGLVSLLLGFVQRLYLFLPAPPWSIEPLHYLQLSMAFFLFAILAGLTHIIRTKGW